MDCGLNPKLRLHLEGEEAVRSAKTCEGIVERLLTILENRFADKSRLCYKRPSLKSYFHIYFLSTGTPSSDLQSACADLRLVR